MIQILFRQNLIMCFYLLVGFFLFRKNLVSKQGSGDIGKVLLYVVMPFSIVKSYLSDFSVQRLKELMISFLLALLALLVSVIVSRLVFRNKYKIEHFGAAFSNAGFMGIPLVQSVLGDEAVFYVSSFVAILNILQWTYGVVVMTDDRFVITFQKIRTNPIVISFIIGIALFVLPIQLPQTVIGVIGTAASMNGPLAMIVLGVYLGQVPLKTLFKERLVYLCTFVRLLLIPLLTIAVLSLFPKSYLTIKMAVLIAAAAPVGSNVAIFAQLYNKAYTQAVKDVCLSTVCSIITMPLMIGIANYIW